MNELAEIIALEEKAAFANDLKDRVAAISELPHAPIRIRIYAVSCLLGAAEILNELEGTEATIEHLTGIAKKLSYVAGNA